jgi:hypothetical protein
MWGFKQGIQGGEGKCLTDIMRRETEAAGMAGGSRKWWRHDQTRAAQGKGMELTSGTRVSVTGEREGVPGGMRKPEGKMYSGDYAKGSQADLAKRRGNGLWGKAGQCGELWAGWAGLHIRFKQEMIFEFQWILELEKTLKKFYREI